MWPFKRKNPAFELPIPAPRQAAITHSQAPDVTPEMLIDSIIAARGKGAHFARYYATMRGFRGETLGSHNIFEFAGIIQNGGPPTALNIQFAADSLCADMDSILRSDYSDQMIYGVDGSDNAHLRPAVTAVQRAYRASGFCNLCSSANFDLPTFLVDYTAELRERDLSAIRSRLSAMKTALRPLLLRSLQKGKNKYGETDKTLYLKEIADWINHCFPRGSLPFFYAIAPSGVVDAITSEWFQDALVTAAIPDDGIDFEHWCAARLERHGWSVVVSQASGDQGVDLEASRDGYRVAVQCKRYTQPIGNKAVQEAFTGMKHYNADAACVIGTGGFTRAAIELAATVGVVLLDAELIDDFSARVAQRLRAN